jgi:putative two-component system response regulator
MFREQAFELVLTDIAMPEISGLELLKSLKELNAECEVIMITGYVDISYAIQAMRHGAYDFFTKPLNFDKIMLTIQRVEERRALRETAKKYEMLRTQKEFEREATMQATRSLLRAVEERDKCNIGHGRRTAEFSTLLGRALGFSGHALERLATAALLHDIGKIGIDDRILNKPGRLNEDEFETIKRHSEIGEYIVAPNSFLKDLSPFIRHHHERFDGTGYPDGLLGEAIPLEARIICLADYFDSITSKRPYRAPMPLKEAQGLIRQESGKIFDPRVVDAFFEVFDGLSAGA